MHQLRPVVKLTFGLATLWLALVWAKILPRPGFLPPEMEIEPLTVVLGTTAVLLFGFWKNVPTAASSANSILESSLQDELIANLKAKYQKRIDSKLAGRFPVNLCITASNKGTSEETAQNFITLQDEEVSHAIGEIFDRAHGRLLVVGLPGAGKTTLLLQLAVELLKQAESVPAALAAVTPAAKAAGTDSARPIPVLLNLATWRSEFVAFDEWLKRILPNELGASKALAEKIRTNIPLILLLDGLDEVPEPDRNSCLEALGQYGMKPEFQFVISSRIIEYTDAKDAPVYSEVEIAPLTAEQIEMNLIAYAGLTPEAKPLLNAIQKDALLKEAIENPFYLNTAQLLFASRKNWSEFGFVATDVEGRQEELVERFVENALGDKVKRDYPAGKANKWLNFLACKMEEQGMRSFELADLEMKWIIQGVWYKTQEATGEIMSFCFLIFLSVLITILIGLNQPGAAIIIFVIIVAFREIFVQIYPTSEIVGWSWNRFKPHYFTGVIIWLIILTIMQMNNANDLWKVLAWTQIILISFFAMQTGLVYNSILKVRHPYERFTASLKYLNYSIVYHLIFRTFLALRSSLPLRLVHFLNEMSRRHLLEFDGNLDTETGGGAWRWRHRIIQEYFLSMNKEE